MTDAPERIWTFDRYVNGVLMAEGVQIERATSFAEACISAARLASRGPTGEVPVLVLTPSPEVAALIAEARREERERCAQECDRIAGNTKDFNHYTRRAAGMCAANIRALKETTHD